MNTEKIYFNRLSTANRKKARELQQKALAGKRIPSETPDKIKRAVKYLRSLPNAKSPYKVYMALSKYSGV